MSVNDAKAAFRLATVIRDMKDKYGNYSKLAKEIQLANNAAAVPVDRRKLSRIANSDTRVTFDLDELRALDRFLAPHGEGLAEKPLLERRALLSTLAAKDAVMMLLGSYPSVEQHNDVSRWDVRALSALQGELGQLHPSTQPRINDVLLREEVATSRKERALFQGYLDDTELSICSIGASRANPASEVALARMFGVRPFVPPKPHRRRPLPFHFIWSPNALKFYPSAFARDAADISEDYPDRCKEIEAEEAWALQVEGELYSVPRTRSVKTWSSYGIVAAQRRENGQVWVVVAGLSGPATFGAALAVVSQKTGPLPESLPGVQTSRICWSLIETPVVVDDTIPGDSRTVGDVRLVLSRTCDPVGSYHY